MEPHQSKIHGSWILNIVDISRDFLAKFFSFWLIYWLMDTISVLTCKWNKKLLICKYVTRSEYILTQETEHQNWLSPPLWGILERKCKGSITTFIKLPHKRQTAHNDKVCWVHFTFLFSLHHQSVGEHPNWMLQKVAFHHPTGRINRHNRRSSGKVTENSGWAKTKPL